MTNKPRESGSPSCHHTVIQYKHWDGLDRRWEATDGTRHMQAGQQVGSFSAGRYRVVHALERGFGFVRTPQAEDTCLVLQYGTFAVNSLNVVQRQ